MAVTNPNTTQLPTSTTSAKTTTPTTPAFTPGSTITPGSSTTTIGKADGGYIDGSDIQSANNDQANGHYTFGPNGQLYDPAGNLVG